MLSTIFCADPAFMRVEPEMTSGPVSDIQQVSKIARAMVTRFGMSDKVGNIDYSSEQESFLGSYNAGTAAISPETQQVIEAEVLSTSPIAGKKINEIDFPEGVLIGAVRKGAEVIRPVGGTRIDEGDVIAIFALAEDVPEVERLMQVSIDFF